MKKLFILCALLCTASSYAQNHMVEFNADSALLGFFNYSKNKEKGSNARHDNTGALYLNFARAVSEHVQAGLQASYLKNDSFGSKFESYSVLVGGIYNFSSDFRESLYTSLYLGWEWDHTRYKMFRNSRDESFLTKVSLGKRFPLTRLNLENVTYSPELTLKSTNGTKSNSNTDWSQELSLKFLQFSFFW